MTTENPFEPHQHSPQQVSPKFLLWTIGSTFGCAMLGGAAGAGLGAALGIFSPGYYRSVFRNGDSPNFDPVAVGIGQGLTQGIVLGTIVGLTLVALYYWAGNRSPK